MTGEVLILGNPKRRRRTRRNPRRMSALQRKYFGPRRNPKRRHHRRSHKRSHRRRSTSSQPFANPTRRRRRIYRRNPIGSGIGGFLSGSLVPATIGALGAVGVDFFLGNVSLPYQLTSGLALPVVKIGAALAMGAAIGALAGSEWGEDAAAGAITVTVYQLARTYFQNNTRLRLARYKPFGRFYRGTYVGRYLGFLKGGTGAPAAFRYRTRFAPQGGHNRLAPFTLNRIKRRRLGAIRRRQAIQAAPRPSRHLGWIGPARTVKGLGRYLGASRNARRGR